MNGDLVKATKLQWETRHEPEKTRGLMASGRFGPFCPITVRCLNYEHSGSYQDENDGFGVENVRATCGLARGFR